LVVVVGWRIHRSARSCLGDLGAPRPPPHPGRGAARGAAAARSGPLAAALAKRQYPFEKCLIERFLRRLAFSKGRVERLDDAFDRERMGGQDVGLGN
jgi:hypothetical protein